MFLMLLFISAFLEVPIATSFFYESFFFLAILLITGFLFKFVIYESEYEILHFIKVPMILLVFISLDTRFKGVEMPKNHLMRIKHVQFLFIRKVYLYFKGTRNEIEKIKISLTWLKRSKQELVLQDLNEIIRRNSLDY